MSQDQAADVPMVPLQEEHNAEDVKVIVNDGVAKDEKDDSGVPLGEQCMEPQCNKRAIGECAIKDCKKRLCVEHKKQLTYAHDHRTLCAVHFQRAQFQFRALLAAVLVIILIGALIWAVPSSVDFCDGKPDGVYCKSYASVATCTSGYGSDAAINCPVTNGIQSRCFQCNPTFASCTINTCPGNSTISP